MKRIVIVVLAACLLSACGVSASSVVSGPAVQTDTPALRALKASAHIESCPVTTAPPTGQMPDASLPCLGGGPSVNLASLRGPLIINVWAQSCAPCREEMPHLQAFAQRYRGKVAVLGVDYLDTPALALGFAKEEGATYPLVADVEGSVVRVAAMPTSFLINAEGKIAYEQTGPFASEAQVEQLVARYLGVQ